jgi:glycosyltransferase involved in cell wall biosynthesis
MHAQDTPESGLPQVVVAMLGARLHYAVPVMLHHAGMLAHFYTDAFVGPGSSWHLPAQLAGLLPDALKPASLRRLLARRANGLPAGKVTAFNLLGWAYASALQRAASPQEKLQVFLDVGARFETAVLRRGFGQGQAVYAFQGAAARLLEAARKEGLRAIFEKFSAPSRLEYHLWAEEYRRWPGWEDPWPSAEVFAPAFELEQREWEAAHLILCPSPFVMEAMAGAGVPAAKLRLLPYGYAGGAAPARRPWDGTRPLRLLFVGGVTLRKGVQYLGLALEQLRGLPLEARMVGHIDLKEAGRARLAAVARLTGQVPRTEVQDHYAWADLFVFPTICDSFGLVQLEALSHGLPVIATTHCGAVVRDGLDGFVIPIRDPEALAARIEPLARNPEQVAWMSENARKRAQKFSWAHYRTRLTHLLQEVCSHGTI